MVNCLYRLERRNHCEGQVCTYIVAQTRLVHLPLLEAQQTALLLKHEAEDGLFRLRKAEDFVLSPFCHEFAANCVKSDVATKAGVAMLLRRYYRDGYDCAHTSK